VKSVEEQFAEWTTAIVSDACLQLGVDPRCAPPGMSQLSEAIAGNVRPVRHYGSVDVFLEAIAASRRGDVLVIDNGGLLTEGCVGDLVAQEAQAAGLAGIVCWGAIRDCREIYALAMPTFSYGLFPCGPRSLRERPADALQAANIGDMIVSAEDFVFADRDGAIFVAQSMLAPVLAASREIWKTERRHAQRVTDGVSLRQQFDFDEYLQRRRASPAYSFREYLKSRRHAIEV
jgi:4-hydroxy-4-methyl-2-oxoglutarate aldolase